MALIFTVKCIPGSGRTAWALDKSGILKCYLKSPPEKGKANSELEIFVAQSLKISRSQVEIMTGHAGRLKRIRIPLDLSYAQLLNLLGFEYQLSLS
jgi:uncharacterized protein